MDDLQGNLRAVPLSVLDLAPIVEGGSAAGALRNAVDLARHAEATGYHRFWLAEHHNIPSVASAATAVVLASVGAATLATPYAMVAVNVVAAPTDDEAHVLFTSLLQMFLGMVRGKRGPMKPPVESMADLWTPQERAAVERMVRVSVVGSPATVGRGLRSLVEATGADELIVTSPIFDHALRLRSYELTHPAFAEAMAEEPAAAV